MEIAQLHERIRREYKPKVVFSTHYMELRSKEHLYNSLKRYDLAEKFKNKANEREE